MYKCIVYVKTDQETRSRRWTVEVEGTKNIGRLVRRCLVASPLGRYYSLENGGRLTESWQETGKILVARGSLTDLNLPRTFSSSRRTDYEQELAVEEPHRRGPTPRRRIPSTRLSPSQGAWVPSLTTLYGTGCLKFFARSRGRIYRPA
ncbi:hypothetical protein KM043_016959 [Ampulex compressa]|nr:hypothetical protein KM043_016959 [Ampulex compressa]